MSELIKASMQGSVLRLQIHRPEKKNALTLDMYTALADHMTRADSDPAVRVMVITGTEGSFTSGNDIADFLQSPPTDENSPVGRFLEALVTARKPIIAAVNGLAVGVGTTMLLLCDLVYASENAVFQMPFVNLGVCPEAGSSLLLPLMMGHQRASELILFGDRFDAKKAAEVGIVNSVYAAGELDAQVMERAMSLAARPPTAVRTAKELLRRTTANQLREAMQAEFKRFVPMLGSAEALEAMTAFMQRRKPDFSQFS